MDLNLEKKNPLICLELFEFETYHVMYVLINHLHVLGCSRTSLELEVAEMEN